MADKYDYHLQDGGLLTLEGDTQPSDDEVESIAKEKGLKLVHNDSHVDDTSAKSVESKVDEHPNKLSELWNNTVNNPTVKKLLTGTNDAENKLASDKGITNIQGPGLMTIPSLDKLGEIIKNKGINSGDYWKGFGGSIAHDLIDLVSSGFDPRAAGIHKSPNDLFPVDHDFDPSKLLDIKAKAPEIAQRAMSNQPSMPRSNNPSYLMKDDINPNNAALSEDTIGKQIAAHRANELDKVRGSASDIPDNDVARQLELERTNKQSLSVDEVNKLFTNTKPLEEGTSAQFGLNKPKVNIDGPKVTSLKPATPELIAQAQKTGPDVIHLKTADKTQLSNAAEYGYQFEGINSDGSLRLRKTPIDIPSNDNIPPNESSGGSGGGGDEPPNNNGNNGHIGDIVDKRKATIAQEVMNLPRGIMASWDLSAPFRQGLGLIHRPEWWKSWNKMFTSFPSEEVFRASQQAIKDKPLFKSYNGQPSLAEQWGLHLTDLTDLSSREEQIMSTWAEKIPGVRPSNRSYTAFLNNLRSNTLENMVDSHKIINQSTGEIDMKAGRELANFINTATGRGSLGSLEKYAAPLNSLFFSPRLIASRLTMLNPMYYMTANPNVRKEAIKSLLAIAGTGTLVTQLGKLAGGTVEFDPVSSDFGKLKIGNTRIDPYGGFQQYIVAANRLLQGRTKSTVSGKETDLTEGKFGKQTRFDIAERFGESKLNPLIGLAITILRGKNLAGQKVDLPEEVASKFVPLFIQDLKTVATENPNLIPFYNELGLDKTDPARALLSLPGGIGMGIQNYPSK